MFTVALIGPDGAGKTTIGRRLENLLPLPVKYMYMGVNHDASNRMLPTTRVVLLVRKLLGKKKDMGGPRDHDDKVPSHKSAFRRTLSGCKSTLSLINRLAEEWYRQGLSWYYQFRRNIVLFDRHYFSDYYAYDIAATAARRSLNRRIHGFVLSHLYPKPDLVIYLDAPAEVLFARKGEGTVELLERRRNDYLQIRNEVKHFEVVDATQSLEEVTAQVSERIRQFYELLVGSRVSQESH